MPSRRVQDIAEPRRENLTERRAGPGTGALPDQRLMPAHDIPQVSGMLYSGRRCMTPAHTPGSVFVRGP